MNTFDKFVEDYNNTSIVVTFDSAWKNGTGYFDGAVKAVALGIGNRAKSCCTDTGRRMLLIGAANGCIVLFERYTPDAGNSKVIVANVPRSMRKLYTGGAVSESAYELFTGPRDNLIKAIEALA